jgi:hypothetical protein
MSVYDLSWFTPEIEEVQAYHRGRVLDLFEGREVDGVVAMLGPMFGRSHGLWGTNEIDMLENPKAWVEQALTEMAAWVETEKERLKDRVTFYPLAFDLDPLGTHWIDAMFGADVRIKEDQVWAEQLPYSVDELEMPDLENCRVFQQSLELARVAVEASQGKLMIGTPVYSCPVNIGINLFGERLLESLVFEPEVAAWALRIINDVILACIRAFEKVVPDSIRRNCLVGGRYTPVGSGYIDGCATQLVSAAHYREFFMPLDNEMLEAYPIGGLLHICGGHIQHIPAWAEMKALRAVQVNDRATDDIKHYVAGLRKDQILYVVPTDNVTIPMLLTMAKEHPIIIIGVLS